MARLLETDSNTNINISSATAIGAYTATTTRLVHVRVAVDQAAGAGDYVIYATLQIAGSGSSYVIIPKTTATAASGETALMFISGPIPMDNADVLTIYLDGLAGDTTTPDTRVDFYEKDYLRPTVAGRTLAVAATGEASANVTLWKGSVPANLIDTFVPVQLPEASSQGIALNSLAPMIETINGGLDDEYNRFKAAALEEAPSITAQEVRDAMMLAPTAGDPAAGSVDAHLDTLISSSAVAGSTVYTNTVTDPDSNPLDGVEVWITSDSGGASTVASTTTNTLGAFTVYLDPGTYYLWLAKGGFNFGNPTTITVT